MPALQPDWDMFHSKHPAALLHATARAVSGGAVYVSDKPGHHNFSLLRRLVLVDGSVLRARLPGRATRDILFDDPMRDGRTLLKVRDAACLVGPPATSFFRQGHETCARPAPREGDDGSSAAA